MATKKQERKKMRKGWEEYTGAEISVRITKGASPRWQGFEYQKTGCVFITSENVRDGHLDTSKPKYLPIEFHKKQKNSQLTKNDILINIVGASIGRVCMYDGRFEDANVNQAVCIFRVSEKVSPDFLLYYFQAPYMQSNLLGSKSDSARPNLSLGDFNNFTFIIPPLAEQRKIAAILRTWDDAIKIHQTLVQAIRKKRKLIIQKSFAFDPAPLKRLSDVADIIVSNVDKKSISGQRHISLCNYMDVFNNRYITSEVDFMVATAADREIQTYALQKDDAVFTKDSETPEEIAVCASVEEDIPNLICGYHLAIARPDNKKILGAYLAEAINSPRVHQQFVKSANGVTRFGLTRGDIDSIELPVPPIDKQEKTIGALRECDHAIKLIQAKIQNLQSQKRGLMQKLLTGQWHVKTSDVEAA
ncbi:MAG: restriction endonuclease subunit S [Candidatus Vecturithrix sp.]|nr:restriction endonuclease subunit S [Candidatus Vecturithrix sp.]